MHIHTVVLKCAITHDKVMQVVLDLYEHKHFARGKNYKRKYVQAMGTNVVHKLYVTPFITHSEIQHAKKLLHKPNINVQKAASDTCNQPISSQLI